MRFHAGALLLLWLQSALVVFAQSGVTIRKVRVVDVERGVVTSPRTVYVAGDRVSASVVAGNGDVRVVDGTGKFLVPGLWNMHGAVTAANATAMVLRGITGVRDMSAEPLSAMLELYRKIEIGALRGPRILTGGPAMTFGSASEARTWFDGMYRTEADFVRFGEGIDPEAYIALAEQSRKWRLPLVGPLPPTVRLMDAVALRQSSIEGTRGLDRVACEGFFYAGRDGVWFTPMTREADRELMRWMRGCGARMLAGAPDGDLHAELEAMVAEGGFTPMAALRAATYEVGQFLGSDVGGVAVGKLADLVLLDADPTLDIRNLRRVRGVVLRGKWIDVPTMGTSATSDSRSGTRPPAASSAKPPASSARPGSPIR
ncbi:hypothetical protein F183_A27170 [Bryobacterales bacterium F-183]|nr:hypothetical protein F183_A27170 [Bryobacterales bacterium F-183]